MTDKRTIDCENMTNRITCYMSKPRQKMVISLAGFLIEVENASTALFAFCEKHLATQKDAELSIRLLPEMLVEEYAISKSAGRDVESMNEAFLQELESLAFYRQICERLVEYDTFLFHASAICYQGKAYLFAAPSGTGKSTQRRLWQEYLGDEVVVIDDDKPLIRKKDGKFYACATPWNGKERLGNPMEAALDGIFFIKRSESPKATRIPGAEAIASVMDQVYLTKQESGQDIIFSLLDDMMKKVSMYTLEADMTQESVKVCLEQIQDSDERVEEVFIEFYR